MRIALAGVSHFHTHYFVDIIGDRPQHQLVGVEDPAGTFAADLGTTLEVPAFTDLRAMCKETAPELVILFGRPADLAASAAYLIESGIPSIIEKPVGVNVAEIRRVKELAEEHGTFATVPFSLRFGLLSRKIKELCGDDELTYASIRVLSGTTERYVNWGLDWNLDPAQCGGGTTLNISSQYFDLIRYLSPSAEWSVKSATMGNALSGYPVEEYSAVLLESPGRSAVVETGYLIPKSREVAISLCIGKRVFRIVGSTRLLIRDEHGVEEELVTPPTQNGWYAEFLEDTISRIDAGLPPAVTLDDMLQAALLTESAYRLTSFDECMKNVYEPAVL